MVFGSWRFAPAAEGKRKNHAAIDTTCAVGQPPEIYIISREMGEEGDWMVLSWRKSPARYTL